jgi:hypothetical protein
MHFNHDGRSAVQLGVSLANQWPADLDSLVMRCVDAGFVFDTGQPTSRDHSFTAEFISEWRDVAAASDPVSRSTRLNALLATHASAPRLTDHAASGWHLHFRDDNISAGRSLATLISVGTAVHLAARGIDRIGICAAHNCDRVYADVSRNGRQRYCSPVCGNRMAARRHREAMRG